MAVTNRTPLRPIATLRSRAAQYLGFGSADTTKHLDATTEPRTPGRPPSANALQPFSALLDRAEIQRIKTFAEQHAISVNQATRLIIRSGLDNAEQGKIRFKTVPAKQTVVFEGIDIRGTNSQHHSSTNPDVNSSVTT